MAVKFHQPDELETWTNNQHQFFILLLLLFLKKKNNKDKIKYLVVIETSANRPTAIHDRDQSTIFQQTNRK